MTESVDDHYIANNHTAAMMDEKENKISSNNNSASGNKRSGHVQSKSTFTSVCHADDNTTASLMFVRTSKKVVNSCDNMSNISTTAPWS